MMTAAERETRKQLINVAQVLKSRMTPEEKIKFLNTPYSQMPSNLQPGMTKKPQIFTFVKMRHPRIGEQNETFGARLYRYRWEMHLTPKQFCEVCNEYAKRFDVPATMERKAQKVRITVRDLDNYENFNVSPKIDKMTVIAGATGMPLDYFAGYGPKHRRSRTSTFEVKGVS